MSFSNQRTKPHRILGFESPASGSGVLLVHLPSEKLKVCLDHIVNLSFVISDLSLSTLTTDWCRHRYTLISHSSDSIENVKRILVLFLCVSLPEQVENYWEVMVILKILLCTFIVY